MKTIQERVEDKIKYIEWCKIELENTQRDIQKLQERCGEETGHRRACRMGGKRWNGFNRCRIEIYCSICGKIL